MSRTLRPSTRRSRYCDVEFAAIDFETTGYEDGNVNEPWQLGFVLVRDGIIVETQDWRFDGDIVERFGEWSGALLSRRLVAHNISTERTILTRVAPLTKWGPWVDTLKLAKAKYPRLPSYALGDLCEMFGLVPDVSSMPELDGRTWHDGLYDAVACAKLAMFLAV